MKGINNHNQTNRLIKWTVIALDFVALWLLLPVVADFIPDAEEWTDDKYRLFWGICTMSMVLAEYWFYSTIHQRMVGAGDILRRGTLLVATQVVVSYLLLRSVGFMYRIGWQLLFMGLALWTVIMLLRFVEREALKRLRRQGFNTRTVTFVGSDEELQRLHQRILSIPSYGYKLYSSYVSTSDFLALLDHPEDLRLGDEVYLCAPRRERQLIERTASLCRHRMIKFYYVTTAHPAVCHFPGTHSLVAAIHRHHHQASEPWSHLLPSAAHGARRARVLVLEVPFHAREQHRRPTAGHQGRPTQVSLRQLHTQDQHRRAAPVLERVTRRHEHRGAPPPHAGTYRAIRQADRQVHGASLRQARHHRLGAGNRFSW